MSTFANKEESAILETTPVNLLSNVWDVKSHWKSNHIETKLYMYNILLSWKKLYMYNIGHMDGDNTYLFNSSI